MATSFGRDTSCTTELKTGRYATGIRLVAESYFRRLTTPRGMLRGGEDEANFGLDLTTKIGTVANRSERAALAGQIKTELGKDDRTLDVDVTIAASTEGPSTTWVVTVEAQTTEGPFVLNIGVSEVSAELLGIGALK